MLPPAELPCGLLISRDLFFTSKVTGTAQQLGCSVQVVPDCATAVSRIASGVFRCVFVDLAAPIPELPELIGNLPAEGRPTVVAFGSHVATAQLQAARDAGCDEVLPRSRFSGELPSLLRKYLLLVLVLFAAFARDATAQFGNVGGVYVDAEGMLRESGSLSQKAQLKLLRHNSEESAPGPVAAVSPLRKVSLRRLEAAVAASYAAKKELPAEIRQLAGLIQVRYVLFRPEESDVVFAGPAEGWKELPSGDVVGLKSGRPVLHLDDLLVALRYAFTTGPRDDFLGCSIDPTENGAKEHASYVSGLSGLDRSQAATILRGMEQAMGPQRIRVFGAPGSSRFALQLIAADYRLKRLALDHDPSPSKKVPSFLDLAAKSVSGGPQPQHRWWFVGHYDAIRFTSDRLAYEFEGTGLRVETAPSAEAIGSLDNPAKPSKAAKLFAEAATRGFPELAAKIPAFAELQNLVALAVAAELLRQFLERTDRQVVEAEQGKVFGAKSEIWRPGTFLDNGTCPIAEYQTPKQTPSLANVRFVKDRHWLFSISGGVELNPAALAGPENLKPASGSNLDTARRSVEVPTAVDRWWWD